MRAIFREIMSASLALEKDLAIAYFGPEATWTHQAARSKFGASVAYIAQPSIGDVFMAVTRGKADFGVVPIENSTEGAVNHTLDTFMDSDLRICAQITLPIEHHLLSRIPRQSIRKIFSHPQVFGQCRQWLHQHFPNVDLIEVSSTSRAGEMAARSEDGAARAGQRGGVFPGRGGVDAGVQDSANNTTRFLVIGARDCPATGQDRTSLMFSVPDRAGALFSALEPLQTAGISMSKIESRPSKRKPWEYVFFVDIEGHRTDAKVVAALQALEARCTFVKILGSYPGAGSIA